MVVAIFLHKGHASDYKCSIVFNGIFDVKEDFSRLQGRMHKSGLGVHEACCSDLRSVSREGSLEVLVVNGLNCQAVSQRQRNKFRKLPISHELYLKIPDGGIGIALVAIRFCNDLLTASTIILVFSSISTDLLLKYLPKAFFVVPKEDGVNLSSLVSCPCSINPANESPAIDT